MDQIEQVRSKTDIVELISSYISLKKAGRNFKALCPFHSEKTPSFIVSPERQIFKCFGCGEGGSVFNFLMKYEGMEFGEALRFLADRAGIKLKSLRPSKTYQEKERLWQINHLALEYYHYVLTKHQVGKIGLQYLKNRGIRLSSIKTFKLGYAPEAWENLQDFLVKKKNYRRQELEKAGLIIRGKRGYYDRFRGRIIFPLFDHRGNTLGFAGRTLKKDLKGAKYINTPETPVYHKSDLFYGLHLNKQAIKKKNQAVIVEGELDVISSHQAGVKNVIAIKGSALTENQVSLIKRFTDNIALALDEDAAGDRAARRGIEIADREGLNIRIIQLLYGKDPDECAQHDPKLWRQSVKKAIPIFDFYLKSASKRFGKKGPEAKKKISEELVPILAKISNEVIKAHYVKKLASLLQVNEEAVLKEMERWKKTKGLEEREERIRSSSALRASEDRRTRRERLEELLLAMVLQQKRQWSKLLTSLDQGHFKTNPVKRILALLEKFVKKKGKDVNKLAKNLPEELLETFDRTYLAELDFLDDKKKFLSAFNKTKAELEKLFLKEKLSQLVEKMKQKEKKGKSATALRKEFDKVLQQIKDLN